jgi:hypothetical protein
LDFPWRRWCPTRHQGLRRASQLSWYAPRTLSLALRHHLGHLQLSNVSYLFLRDLWQRLTVPTLKNIGRRVSYSTLCHSLSPSLFNYN